MVYSRIRHGRCRVGAALQSGLTLIELLVAISVLAFVAVLGWRGLDTIVRTRMALNSDLAQTRGMQLAFAQMQTDCARIVTSLQFPDRQPIAIGPNRVLLVRSVVAENQPTRMQVVSYRVINGVLTRQESPATRDLAELEQMWQAASNEAEAAGPVALQSGVISMTTRLWDGRGWRSDNTAPRLPALSDGRTSRWEVERQVTGATPGPAPLTGLEVALQLEGRNAAMLKIFLLGAV